MPSSLRRSLAFALALLASIAGGAAAQAEDVSADAIMKRTLEHDPFGFDGARVKARWILVDAENHQQERAFEAVSRKDPDGQKSVLRFTAPSNVAGTAFLMLQHDGAPATQYIYLPRMKTTRRIADTGEKDGSFMGSDFSYADLERRALRSARYTRAADEAIGKDPCYHVSVVPSGDSVYSRLEVWIRQKDFIPLRTQMFAKDGQLEKTMFTRRISVVDGRPVIVESRTENAREHHATELVIDQVDFAQDIPESLFTPSALSR